MERCELEAGSALLESKRTELDGCSAARRVDTLDSAGLWERWSRWERSVTSMTGKLTGVENGETGTEPFGRADAPPKPYGSCDGWSEVEGEAAAETDLERLWSPGDCAELSLLMLRKMFLNVDIRS